MAKLTPLVVLIPCFLAAWAVAHFEEPKPPAEAPEQDVAAGEDQVGARRNDVAADPVDRVSEAQLNRAVPELTFDEVAFADVVDFLRDITNANLFVNWRALEAAGIDRNAPVTMRLRVVTFRKAMEVLLESVGGGKGKLGFEVDGGVITISTVEDLGLNYHTRAYDIRDLLQTNPGGPADAERAKRLATLTKLVSGSVAPASWRDKGGNVGALRQVEDKLVITQAPEHHDAIANLLTQTRALLGLKPMEGPAPVVPEPKD